MNGSVTFDFAGRVIDMHAATPPEIAAIRWRHLSYIMQGSMSVLNPVRRVRHAFVDFAHRHIARPMPEFLDIVRAHLERLRLTTDVLEAYPHELSGGMRQRVTIALATVCRPDFIIADEPTTALDVVVQKDVLTMIREIQREIGSSLLFVTHDLAVHANLCDRLGIMYAGRLVEEGPTADLLRAPRHPYTAHLVASLPRIGDTTPKASLSGTPPNLADPPPGCRFHPRCPLAMEICRREVAADAGHHASRRLFRRIHAALNATDYGRAPRTDRCHPRLHQRRSPGSPARPRSGPGELRGRRSPARDLRDHRRVRQRQDDVGTHDPEHRVAQRRQHPLSRYDVAP